MAITKVGGPSGKVNTSYNTVVYYFDSTNKTNDGFRYVAVIKDEFANILFEKTLIPDFNNQYGILNLNRELSNYISYNLDFDNIDGDVYDADKSYLEYELEIGEEYYESWDWMDMGYAGAGNWVNYNDPAINTTPGPKTMIYNTDDTEVPGYSPGESIFITRTNDSDDAAPVTGVHTVLDVYLQGSSGAEWVIVLDLPYISGNSYGGGTRYSDNRKSRFSNLYSLQNEVVFNTALSKKDWLTFDYLDYNMKLGNSGNQKFLTQMYDDYKVRADSTIFLQWMGYDTSGTTSAYDIFFENDIGTTSIYTFSPIIPRNIQGFDFSPTRTDWGAGGTIITPTTLWYEFTLRDINSDVISETKRIYIDRDCHSIDRTEVLFMDKMGSFIPFQFNGRAVESHSIDRSDSNTYLGGFDATTTEYSYELNEGGKSVYNSSYSRSFKLQTDYLNNTESLFFHNVVESPVTMVKIDGDYYSCVIKTSNVEIKKPGWYEQKKYTIDVVLSNKESINI